MKNNPFEFDVWMCESCGYIISDKEVMLLKFNILNIECRCGANNQKHLHFKKALEEQGIKVKE